MSLRPRLVVPLLVLAACQGSDMPPLLSVSHEPPALSELAWEAVALAPDWLQDDLAINLGLLEETLQDELAAQIIDLDEPWLTDEVAFATAFTSPEVLEYSYFYPELLVENARIIYDRDPDLAFVELVDEGEPGVDAGYYTTATYQVETESGEVVSHTIDPEIYYWYVVHPRLEDELPWYVDGWSSGDPTTAQDGSLWRQFLWDEADEECPADRECPLLADMLSGVDVLWRSKSYSMDDNGAMGVLIDYVQRALVFGAGSERPTQPNRIYAVMYGNCGEHADLSCAAARTALIPCQNVGARANDHTWNEFWDEGWMQWEPVNTYLGHWTYYADENGDYYRTRDLKDNDCDGLADDGLDDVDGDGDGYSVANGDCDDTDAAIFPGAAELPNAMDDDCDGLADEDSLDGAADGDGDGWSILDGDCDDTDGDVFPGQEEAQDSRDDDCNGWADEGFAWQDADVDGDGFTLADGDCDDDDASIYPGAPESDNGRDDDCDGLADGSEGIQDMDGDGFTESTGDCDDNDASVYPGAQEVGNGHDDDCDGIADDGMETGDRDGDGYTVDDGDCHDGDAAVYPGATEEGNGYDDDCDGIADNGLDASDRDGDGYTMDEGDCRDMDPSFNPGVDDPMPSTNRLFAITDTRGDTAVSTERTEDYANTAYLEFLVTDEDSNPVDGAVVNIYGNWGVYGYPDYPAWAAEVVTDLDGMATATVGESNTYTFKVVSPFSGQEEGGYETVTSWSEVGETYQADGWVQGSMPDPLSIGEASLAAEVEREVTLSWEFQVESYRVAADGAYYGSMSLELEGGRVDTFVVDEDALADFEAGGQFDALAALRGQGSGSGSLDLPRDRAWFLVLANQEALSSTMVGTLQVSAIPAEGFRWEDEDALSLDVRFRIPPGEHLAVSLE